jgi:hypothetical protein
MGSTSAGKCAATSFEPDFVPRERRSFEVSHVHALWHFDFHEAKRSVALPNGERRKPVLLAILDDHSRLCCHAQWYLDPENTESLVHGLCQAFQKRGLPRAVLSSVDLVDPRSATHLCTLLPLDKEKNSDRRRRSLAPAPTPSTTSEPKPSPVGIAPLLRSLMAGYAATGLPPAYLPKNDPTIDTQTEEEES